MCLFSCLFPHLGGRLHKHRDCFMDLCVSAAQKLSLAYRRLSINTHGIDEETLKDIKECKIASLLSELFSSCAYSSQAHFSLSSGKHEAMHVEGSENI